MNQLIHLSGTIIIVYINDLLSCLTLLTSVKSSDLTSLSELVISAAKHRLSAEGASEEVDNSSRCLSPIKRCNSGTSVIRTQIIEFINSSRTSS